MLKVATAIKSDRRCPRPHLRQDNQRHLVKVVPVKDITVKYVHITVVLQPLLVGLADGGTVKYFRYMIELINVIQIGVRAFLKSMG